MIRFLAPDPDRQPDPTLHVTLAALVKGRLGPALYERLSKAGLLSRLPPNQQEVLREAYLGNARRNLIREHELRRVVAALGRRRISAMPLKGAISLLEPIYSSPSVRVMNDLDLLVKPDHRQGAIDCLAELGYRPKTKELVLLDAEYPMEQGGITVDLHWHLLRIAPFGDAEPVWNRAQPLDGPWGTLFLPSPLDQFYIRFLHDTLQDHHLHRVHLWQAYEAALLFRRLEARREVPPLLERAAQDGLALILGVYLAQTDRLFPCISRLEEPALRRILDRGRSEVRALEALGPLPRFLHFAVGRDLLLRLRKQALGGYRRAFVQILWRESTLAEPTDVVPPMPVSRLAHILKLAALQVLVVLWRLGRRVLPHPRRPSSP
ncbi:nucleotidyltransferase family protein [Nitrospira sp. Kam-Ns4a]